MSTTAPNFQSNRGRDVTDVNDLVALYDKTFADDGAGTTRRRPRHWSTDFPVDGRPVAPSADDSVRSLVVRRKQTGTWVPRPSFLVRGMWLVLVLTLAVLTVFAGLLAHLVAGIADGVRADLIEPTQVLQEPLPDSQKLRDAQSFGLLLEQRPQRRLDLEFARLQALLEVDDLLQSRQLLLDLAQPHRLRELSPGQRLQLIEGLVSVRDSERARYLLMQSDWQRWNAEQRRRATGLAGRLHLAQRGP
ncbi:MAG: hypothetical protein EA402_02865 [Planctomycetota bacterium]|nr:MAG: hypothetical protein EA402_02865 [Planctomycetota bacterium]